MSGSWSEARYDPESAVLSDWLPAIVSNQLEGGMMFVVPFRYGFSAILNEGMHRGLVKLGDFIFVRVQRNPTAQQHYKAKHFVKDVKEVPKEDWAPVDIVPYGNSRNVLVTAEAVLDKMVLYNGKTIALLKNDRFGTIIDLLNVIPKKVLDSGAVLLVQFRMTSSPLDKFCTIFVVTKAKVAPPRPPPSFSVSSSSSLLQSRPSAAPSEIRPRQPSAATSQREPYPSQQRVRQPSGDLPPASRFSRPSFSPQKPAESAPRPPPVPKLAPSSSPRECIGLVIRCRPDSADIWCDGFDDDVLLISDFAPPSIAIGQWLWFVCQQDREGGPPRVIEPASSLSDVMYPTDTRVVQGVVQLETECTFNGDYENDGTLVLVSDLVGRVVDFTGQLDLDDRHIRRSYLLWVEPFYGPHGSTSRWQLAVDRVTDRMGERSQQPQEHIQALMPRAHRIESIPDVVRDAVDEEMVHAHRAGDIEPISDDEYSSGDEAASDELDRLNEPAVRNGGEGEAKQAKERQIASLMSTLMRSPEVRTAIDRFDSNLTDHLSHRLNID